MLTYEFDIELAKEGVIVIHNLFLDEELRSKISNYSCNYYISMPTELSNQQKEIISNIIDNYDMENSWFSTLVDGNLEDITYDEIKNILSNKNK